MQHVESLLGNRMPSFDPATLMKMADFDSKTADHLRDVYAVLALTIAAATAGAAAHLKFHFGGAGTGIGCFLALLYLGAGSSSSRNNFDNTRFGVLLGFGFLKGASIGGLVEQALFLDQSGGIVVTALLATAVVFGCFSCAAIFSRRRAYLYLGGILGSIVFYMFIGSLINMFLGWKLLNDVSLYGGLLVFCGYVVFDTQVIIEKASAGHKDVIKHALELFIDFAAIFVRILIILMRAAEKNKRNDSNSRKKRND